MVEIKNLSLDYGEVHILDDISLSIAEGECVLFTGKSGSGKSSLINSINGLAVRYDNAKTKGEIIIDGKNIKDLELYQISMLVSTVFQNPKTYFFNVNTTLELLFYLENIGLAKEEMDRRLKNMLEIFPIKNLLNRNIFNLSGGEKQILCIAASYIAGTKIIVMDEPSSNLDIKSISVLAKMLKILKEKGISIIVAEHRIYYLMGFLKFIPLTLIAILMFFFSSLKDGKNLNITAIGMERFFGILSLSIDEIIAPTSEVFIMKLAAINGNKNILKIINKLKNILIIGFILDSTIKLGKAYNIAHKSIHLKSVFLYPFK